MRYHPKLRRESGESASNFSGKSPEKPPKCGEKTANPVEKV